MANVNPINGVPFGQEKTREEYLARAAWEYDQASRLRGVRKPVGYTALAEGHERAAKDYERAAEGKQSKGTTRAHATMRDRAADLIASYQPWTSSYSNEDADRAQGLANRLTAIDREEGRPAPAVGYSKVRYAQAKQVVEDTNRYGEKQQKLSAGRRSTHATIATTRKGKTAAKTAVVYIVQGNYGFGQGWEDLTAEDDRNEARARVREYRENVRNVPFRVIRRRERINDGATSHARKKKIDPHEAKSLIQSDGIDFRRDFHELSSSEVERVLEVARLAGYRKSKNAPGSTARMYFQYLSRLK